MGGLKRPIMDRILLKTCIGVDCWEWTGVTEKGYGAISYEGRHQRAHRIMYELLVGPIPEGLVLDHLCRNRACVRPSHLEPVTHAENIARGEAGKWNSDKTHCPLGHLYDDENTYRHPTYRQCRTCMRDRARSERKVSA